MKKVLCRVKAIICCLQGKNEAAICFVSVKQKSPEDTELL